jgi:short-subunit dehydrogenase
MREAEGEAAFITGGGSRVGLAVHGLSDALRWSLLPHGIGVSMVSPGLVKSKICGRDLVRPGEHSTDVAPADREFIGVLPGLHEIGMDSDEMAKRSCTRSSRVSPTAPTRES